MLVVPTSRLLEAFGPPPAITDWRNLTYANISSPKNTASLIRKSSTPSELISIFASQGIEGRRT